MKNHLEELWRVSSGMTDRRTRMRKKIAEKVTELMD